MLKRELYNKKMHLTFIPLRSIKAGGFDVITILQICFLGMPCYKPKNKKTSKTLKSPLVYHAPI